MPDDQEISKQSLRMDVRELDEETIFPAKAAAQVCARADPHQMTIRAAIEGNAERRRASPGPALRSELPIRTHRPGRTSPPTSAEAQSNDLQE
jgi:hypothetical protein